MEKHMNIDSAQSADVLQTAQSYQQFGQQTQAMPQMLQQHPQFYQSQSSSSQHYQNYVHHPFQQNTLYASASNQRQNYMQGSGTPAYHYSQFPLHAQTSSHLNSQQSQSGAPVVPHSGQHIYNTQAVYSSELLSVAPSSSTASGAPIQPQQQLAVPVSFKGAQTGTASSSNESSESIDASMYIKPVPKSQQEESFKLWQSPVCAKSLTDLSSAQAIQSPPNTATSSGSTKIKKASGTAQFSTTFCEASSASSSSSSASSSSSCSTKTLCKEDVCLPETLATTSTPVTPASKKKELAAKRRLKEFDGLTEEEISQKMLPDHLREGLDIVIIGINPSLTAAHVGHHYAGPGNHFWTCVTEAGLVPPYAKCHDDHRMLEYGIGFTNVCTRPTRGAADLSRKEMKEGAELLLTKLRHYLPKIACFNGKGIYESFIGNKNFYMGKQPDPVPGTDTIVFVMPSSSARCAQLPRAADKLPFYHALKKLRSFVRGEVLDLVDSTVIFPDYTEMRVTQPDPKSIMKAERRRKRKAEQASEVDAVTAVVVTTPGAVAVQLTHSSSSSLSSSSTGGGEKLMSKKKSAPTVVPIIRTSDMSSSTGSSGGVGMSSEVSVKKEEEEEEVGEESVPDGLMIADAFVKQEQEKEEAHVPELPASSSSISPPCALQARTEESLPTIASFGQSLVAQQQHFNLTTPSPQTGAGSGGSGCSFGITAANKSCVVKKQPIETVMQEAIPPMNFTRLLLSDSDQGFEGDVVSSTSFTSTASHQPPHFHQPKHFYSPYFQQPHLSFHQQQQQQQQQQLQQQQQQFVQYHQQQQQQQFVQYQQQQQQQHVLLMQQQRMQQQPMHYLSAGQQQVLMMQQHHHQNQSNQQQQHHFAQIKNYMKMDDTPSYTSL